MLMQASSCNSYGCQYAEKLYTRVEKKNRKEFFQSFDEQPKIKLWFIQRSVRMFSCKIEYKKTDTIIFDVLLFNFFFCFVFG